MKVELTYLPIDYASLVEEVRSHQSGAVVLFLGTVREWSEGKDVGSLDYDAHESMAKRKLLEVMTEASSRWPIQRSAVVHRIGHLELGEIAVAVVTASAHREPAFQAGQWIMDTIKKVVPIWKRENWRDGSANWVHPVDTTSADARELPRTELQGG